jgi:serine---pyruvate transaminase
MVYGQFSVKAFDPFWVAEWDALFRVSDMIFFRFAWGVLEDRTVVRKPLLFLPGPMQVPDHIRSAADRPMFNHRSVQMDDFLAKQQAGCRSIFGTTGDVLFLSSSGTGAMESAIVNMTSPGEEVIVIVGGTFAARWADIGKAYGLKVREIEVDWRNGATLSDVEQGLADYPDAKVVFSTWSESSTGVLTDLGGIGRLVRSQNRFLVADAVSGLAVSPLLMDEWNIDVVIAGSQKGLMLPPGLGIVAVGSRGWERAESSKSPRFYWDWKQYKQTSPFTPAITILFQLDAALDYIKVQGHDRFFTRKSAVAGRIRELVSNSGFEIYARKQGNGITAVIIKEGFDADAFKRHLERDFGIQIAGGLGRLKENTFRIGHVGFVTDEELDYFTQSFKHCLAN